jgi:hypothetical protein
MDRKPMFYKIMLGLRESLSRPLHTDGNPWDDGPLPDFTSGLMWTATGLFGAVALVLPGSDRSHVALALGLGLFSVAWGLFSLVMAARGRVLTIEVRALVTATMMPIVALALWATGGATSFIQPVMIFTALFISYFFPPRLAWPLMALFGYAYATPLFYDERVLEVGYPARLLMFVLAVGGATVAVQFLKGRLVRAELHQRTMAELDPLTGVANRRGFDLALERAAATGEPYALILVDLDDFKRVNDEEGHPAGDAVLRSVAVAAASVARQGDCCATCAHRSSPPPRSRPPWFPRTPRHPTSSWPARTAACSRLNPKRPVALQLFTIDADRAAAAQVADHVPVDR